MRPSPFCFLSLLLLVCPWKTGYTRLWPCCISLTSNSRVLSRTSAPASQYFQYLTVSICGQAEVKIFLLVVTQLISSSVCTFFDLLLNRFNGHWWNCSVAESEWIITISVHLLKAGTLTCQLAFAPVAYMKQKQSLRSSHICSPLPLSRYGTPSKPKSAVPNHDGPMGLWQSWNEHSFT